MTPQVLNSDVAERGVISGVLHNPVERFDLVHEQLPEGAFYFEQNTAAWAVLQDMRASHRPIEPRGFTIRAADLGLLARMGGENAVNDLLHHRPTDLHFRNYLQTLKEKRALRQLNDYADWLKSQVYEPGGDPAELVELAQTRVMDISLERNQRDPKHVAEVLEEIDADLREHMKRAAEGHKIPGLETGLVRMDELIGGMERGERRLITGLSNSGKTWREMQIVRHLSEQGERILLFMLDGKDKEAIIRLYADVAGVELGFLLSGSWKLEDPQNRLAKLARAKAVLQQRGIFIDDTARSIQEINAITRRMVKKHGITGTCIDFFGRCTSVGFKNNDKVGMLASVADQWATCVDDHKGKIWSVMLAQAQQTDIGVGEPIPQGPACLKDCKTLYDVATKGEGLSRETRGLDKLKSEELRISDTDRNAAGPLRDDEQFILNTAVKSKTTRLGHVWMRLQGNMGHITDFNPGARIGDAKNPALARLYARIDQGGPNYASSEYTGPRGRPRKEAEPLQQGTLGMPPKPAIFSPTGQSMHGLLKITRPNRPQEGEVMPAPEEEEN